jgi:hypothetical protein
VGENVETEEMAMSTWRVTGVDIKGNIIWVVEQTAATAKAAIEAAKEIMRRESRMRLAGVTARKINDQNLAS